MSLYRILGVNPSATQAEIRAAYLKMAKQWHPDRNPGNEAEAERRFKEIAHAYDVLSDPDKRAAYDASGAADEQSSGFESSMDEDAAFDLFISVLLDLAFELARSGADQITIYQALIDMGCPLGTAKKLAQKAHKLAGDERSGGSRGESPKVKPNQMRGNGGTGGTQMPRGPASKANDPDATFPAGPWSRWFARSLDLLVGATIASPLIGWLLQWLWALEPAPLRLAAYVVLVAPIPFIVDAIIVGIFGNSLGKALLKIRVVSKTKVEGQETILPIGFGDALFRNLEMWLKGFWGSIPFVAAIPQFLAYLKVSEGKKVAWDIREKDPIDGRELPDFEVIRQKTRWELIAAFVVCLAIFPVIAKAGAELSAGSIPNISSPDAGTSTAAIASDAAEAQNDLTAADIAPNTTSEGSYNSRQIGRPIQSENRDYKTLRATFYSNPAGAQIYISGVFLGISPATLDINYTEKDVKNGHIATVGGFAKWPDGRVSENFGQFYFPAHSSGRANFTFEPYNLPKSTQPDLNPLDNPPLENNPLNPLSGY